MQKLSRSNTQNPPPAHRFLSLGWKLALSTTLIISVVMGVISVSQQLIDLKNERKVQQELLQLSLTPLVVRLESAPTLDAMRLYVNEFHEAYVKKGYPVHHVMLNDMSEQQITYTLDTSANDSMLDDENIDYFRVDIPIVSPLFEGGKGNMVVIKDNSDYTDATRRSWLLWLAHFTVTVGVVCFFLVMITYYQVTRPINRLVLAVKKMERGYWGSLDIGEGAWEIRWLTWRFGNMVQEVQNTMKHLLEAERKARFITFDRIDTALPFNSPSGLCDPMPKVSNPADSPEYQKLLVVCEQLESGTPDDAKAKQLGHSVKEQEVLEANRLGFHQLKARMENAALRLIDPITYTTLDERLNTYKASWRPWAEQLRDTMQRNLENAGIPCAGILHRVKHTAGVWAKMQDKDLDIDEVYDLFAFRIIVPTEADCYAVLDIIHQTYMPEVSRFKDYIATPKDNGYRSLHTCVQAEEGPIFEVQIRSIAMDRQAEQGGAAHWIYKEDGRESEDKSKKQNWWYKILNKFL